MSNWPLHQLDVKNAFLHGVLSKPVYMEQPPGYVDPRFPNHVCCLKKSIYGLKQASRPWFQRFSNFLIQLGFCGSLSDSSLFFYSHGSVAIFLSMLRRFTSRLNSEFAIKDLGKLNYFLGLEVTYTSSGIFLGQAKYANDILSRLNFFSRSPSLLPWSLAMT